MPCGRARSATLAPLRLPFDTGLKLSCTQSHPSVPTSGSKTDRSWQCHRCRRDCLSPKECHRSQKSSLRCAGTRSSEIASGLCLPGPNGRVTVSTTQNRCAVSTRVTTAPLCATAPLVTFLLRTKFCTGVSPCSCSGHSSGLSGPHPVIFVLRCLLLIFLQVSSPTPEVAAFLEPNDDLRGLVCGALEDSFKNSSHSPRAPRHSPRHTFGDLGFASSDMVVTSQYLAGRLEVLLSLSAADCTSSLRKSGIVAQEQVFNAQVRISPVYVTLNTPQVTTVTKLKQVRVAMAAFRAIVRAGYGRDVLLETAKSREHTKSLAQHRLGYLLKVQLEHFSRQNIAEEVEERCLATETVAAGLTSSLARLDSETSPDAGPWSMGRGRDLPPVTPLPPHAPGTVRLSAPTRILHHSAGHCHLCDLFPPQLHTRPPSPRPFHSTSPRPSPIHSAAHVQKTLCTSPPLVIKTLHQGWGSRHPCDQDLPLGIRVRVTAALVIKTFH